MGHLSRLGSIALVGALFAITGIIAWVLTTSVGQASDIREETEEVGLVLEIDATFHGEVAVVDQLMSEILVESPAGEGEPPRTAHLNLTAHRIDAAGVSFRSTVAQLEPLLGREALLLDVVVMAHDAFLESVDELHDARHGEGGASAMGLYHSTVRPLEAEIDAAILELRLAQNEEIVEAVERMAALETLLRREIPALLVLAFIVALAAYRLRNSWRRHRHRVRELERINLAKSQFIASVSHELRTPLTGVVGFAELLSDGDVELSPLERAEIIESIAHQGFEVAGIVEDLLVAARAELGDLKVASVPVDLRAQVAQVLESWQPGTTVPVEIAGEDVRAYGDPLRVRQILRNLFGNAVRHGGDVICVEIGANDPSRVYVSVKDNGAGVPEESWARMFQPFERVHDNPGLMGSIGLGLAVSRQLAQLMEGDLTYQYQDGKSIFALSLPAAPSSSHLAPQTEGQTTPA